MQESNTKNSKCLAMNFSPFIDIIAAVSSPYSITNPYELNLSLIPSYATDLVSQGVKGIFLCGTNGESVSLSIIERKALLEAWINTPEYKGKNLRIIIHIGHHCLKDSLDLASHAVELGVEAIAIMPPSFFRPLNEFQTADYVVEIAKQYPKTAVYYYHFPAMTNVRINLAKTLQLANEQAPNIVGAKFTDIDLADLGTCACKGFNILIGNDALFLSGLVSGASGLIALQCNYIAEFPLAIWTAFQKGDLQTAMLIQEKSRDFVRIFGVSGAVTKEAIKCLRGLNTGTVRLPQKGLCEKEQVVFKHELESWLKEKENI